MLEISILQLKKNLIKLDKTFVMANLNHIFTNLLLKPMLHATVEGLFQVRQEDRYDSLRLCYCVFLFVLWFSTIIIQLILVSAIWPTTGAISNGDFIAPLRLSYVYVESYYQWASSYLSNLWKDTSKKLKSELWFRKKDIRSHCLFTIFGIIKKG